MIQDIIFVLATAIDTFFMSLSYAGQQIRIPLISSFIITFINSASLTVSIYFSSTITLFLPDEYCKIISGILLAVIGIVILCKNIMKSLLKKFSGKKTLSFSLSDIGFVLSIYIDETKADSDCSKNLSPKESVALALVLSFDSICGGIAAGINNSNGIFIGILSLFIGLIFVQLGKISGKSISKTNADFSWCSGIFLLFLSVLRFLD